MIFKKFLFAMLFLAFTGLAFALQEEQSKAPHREDNLMQLVILFNDDEWRENNPLLALKVAAIFQAMEQRMANSQEMVYEEELPDGILRHT